MQDGIGQVQRDGSWRESNQGVQVGSEASLQRSGMDAKAGDDGELRPKWGFRSSGRGLVLRLLCTSYSVHAPIKSILFLGASMQCLCRCMQPRYLHTSCRLARIDNVDFAPNRGRRFCSQPKQRQATYGKTIVQRITAHSHAQPRLRPATLLTIFKQDPRFSFLLDWRILSTQLATHSRPRHQSSLN
jgi:hypothetical protein